MPDTEARSIFDFKPDDAMEARLAAAALADVAAGHLVSHERVREWLTQLANGEKVPPPRG